MSIVFALVVIHDYLLMIKSINVLILRIKQNEMNTSSMPCRLVANLPPMRINVESITIARRTAAPAM